MTTRGTFDQAIDALGHKYRRRLLLALSDHNPQDDTDPQNAEAALGIGDDSELDRDDVPVSLAHVHLPKLAEYGYIDWGRDTGQIFKGPNWPEIEPLLELLANHEDELPDDWL